MKMKITDAERKKVPLRMLLTGPPGCGKTLTALCIAKGIQQITGFEPLIIDSESQSSMHYACNKNEDEEIARKYKFKHLDLYVPKVENFIAAIKYARDAGYKNLIIDSISHEWMDILEQVDDLTKSKSKDKGGGFRAWGDGTTLHRRFVYAILTYPGHVICTCRSKIKHDLVERPNGTKAVKVLGLSPEQRNNTPYEFSIQFDGIDTETNTFHCSKDRTNGLFQGKDFEKPGEEIGIEIVNWLMAGSGDEMYIQVDPEILEARIAITEGLELMIPEFAKKIKENLGCDFNKCDDPDKLHQVTTWLRSQYKVIKNRRK